MLEKVLLSHLWKVSQKDIVMEMADKLESILKKHDITYSKKEHPRRAGRSIEFRAGSSGYAIRFEIMPGYGSQSEDLPNPYVLMGGLEKQGEITYYQRESLPKGEPRDRRPFDITTEEPKILKYAEYLINVYLKDDHDDPDVLVGQFTKEYKRINDKYEKAQRELAGLVEKFHVLMEERKGFSAYDVTKVPEELEELHLSAIRLGSTGRDIFGMIYKDFQPDLKDDIRKKLFAYDKNVDGMTKIIEHTLSDPKVHAQLALFKALG